MMNTTKEVLLAAVEAVEKIEKVINRRALQGQEGAVIEAVKAAFEHSRQGLISELTKRA